MSLQPGDKAAAFTGLIGGAIAIFVTVVVIMNWTNSKFEGHAAGTPAAGQHAAPAGAGH